MRLSFRIVEKIKNFDRQKIKEFSTTKAALKETNKQQQQKKEILRAFFSSFLFIFQCKLISDSLLRV